MILAVDVYYKGNVAKAASVLFDWDSETPHEVASVYIDDVEAYTPGEFYKRELPCILSILKEADLSKIEAVLIDGYVYLDNEGLPGLGARLWEELGKKTPVIGIAKTPFAKNTDTVIKVSRPASSKPLYVSAAGLDLDTAAERVKNMAGNYRIPEILNALDRETKDNWTI
jgi:deoxyribonuclease V